MSEDLTIPLKVGPYRLLKTIGTGSYATVKLAYRGDIDQTIACRIIPKTKMTDETDRIRFENEIRIQQQLYHPNIVRLLDILQDSLNYYCILEMCPSGELYQYIATNGKLDSRKAATLFKQIILALDYLHSRKIAHRDLKPENIFLIHNDFIKLGDFGFSKAVTGMSALSSKTACGSPGYVAPELLKGSGYNPLKSDMWSVGVILYAMLTAKVPWTTKNRAQMFEQISKGEYFLPIYVEDDARDLIQKLMVVDPDKRLTTSEVLKHPFITKNARDIHYSKETKIVTLKKLDTFFELDDGTYGGLEKIQLLRRTVSCTNKNFESVKKIIERKPIVTIICYNKIENYCAQSLQVPKFNGLPALQVRHRCFPNFHNNYMNDWKKIRRCILKGSKEHGPYLMKK